MNVNLHEKEESGDVIKDLVRERLSRSFGQVQCNQRIHIKGKQESQIHRRKQDNGSSSQSDTIAGRGLQAKEGMGPLELKRQGMNFPLEP